MKTSSVPALLSALLAANYASAVPTEAEKRDVNTAYPYKGPTVPVGDFVDQAINGNGKGYPRLVEPPAVTPASKKPTNNINVIQVSYAGPTGVNIHFQTPFGIGGKPLVKWGTSSSKLNKKAKGQSSTYAREPPCSLVSAVTQCSEYFHNVQITGLQPDTQYYYQIPGGNGTTPSQTLSFKTSRAAGDATPFSIAVLNDMGYTNAQGTHKYLSNLVNSNGVDFAWHGGDISYADDWYSGVLPCQLTGDDSWPVCYNGTDTSLPNSPPVPIPAEYKVPLPAGEVPSQGGPQGGDMNVIYESNWDLWQNWMNQITTKIPYMALPGNHEAACAEFDDSQGTLAAYLNEDKPNSTTDEYLSYWSCPPSQRNFTTFQYRFRMPGPESGGVGNFWYSFDYGLVHFIALDSETDFPYSPEYPFIADTKGAGGTPTPAETYPTDSGPFGYINGSYKDNESYEQYNWLISDLKAVNRTATPWVIAMAHRPMYSSQISGYQADVRNAFEDVLIQNGVDMYLAGHIHWYERLQPLNSTGGIDKASVLSKNAYQTNPGTSLVHVINGMAGNIESHSYINTSAILPISAVLNQYDYGFSKLTVNSATQLTWQYIMGKNGKVGDEFTLTKKKTTPTGYTA